MKACGLFLAAAVIAVSIVTLASISIWFVKENHTTAILYHKSQCVPAHQLTQDILDTLGGIKIKEYTMKTCKYDEFDWSEE